MINDNLRCSLLCNDTNKDMVYPKIKIDTNKVKMVVISECPLKDHSQYFYHDNNGSFFLNTQIVFKEAGIEIHNYDNLLELGVYLTTAIKCSKIDYLVSSNTIKECSRILEYELNQFPNIKVIMCMGDFSIKAINYIYKNNFKIAPIKTGSTYKIRKDVHELNGIRFFPSYTHTGDSFNIEKSKKRMIIEDLIEAVKYIENVK